MADDEQFSLCWNNFNSNLSAGFHESLCRGDLVDVTLAAEGQFVKAHRLVLSVCSPYFRKMFTQMPANQHAFVFLKDVSHTALKDLIQFMYCGEVNVKQEALPAFISTAEALQIKGLTDSDPPPSQSPAEPSTPSPQIQQISSPRVRQRTSTSRSFKIESVEDSGDDKQTQIVIQTTAAPAAQQVVAQPQTQHLQTQSQTHIAPQQIATTTTATTTTVVTHKRPARSIGSGPHIKRTKSTIDPLDTTDVSTGTQQITVQTAVVAAPAPETKTQVQQQQSEPEYIDLPIELPTKSEPDYAEDAGDVDGGENETTYVEDDSYGELRYDESYFTENDDTPAGATTVQTGTGSGGGVNATTSKALVKQQQSSFTDTSYVDVADQGNSDAQVVLANDVVPNPEDVLVFFTQSLRGRPAIMANGVRFLIMSENKKKILWRCSSMATKKIKCPARITMIKGSPPKFIINKAEHIHAELKRNKYGSSKQAQHQQHHHHQQQQQYDQHQQELNQQCYSVTAMKGDEEHELEVDGNVKIEILTQSIGSSTLQRQQHQ
ncbi:modifier of mdg4-like isoform X2 [Bactrocera neohumeralis]|uniref:modifier of mdg4-like isoform X3 n=1 Tax=Bactrocera tryoni TaxID=59916 RepID=UPI001A9748EF|nr:modifier of mdg4-like isoform X3 [Bactrocera tryoni]XP_050326548.1 modifier of mdg4-like isoform X2 [Bactrocera neohumeralis]